MNSLMKIGAVSVLALSTAAPAFAQYYQPTPEYQRQQQDYQYQRQQYEAQRQQYDARRDRYDNNRSNYERTSADYRAARADYEARLAEWDRARVRYDARYGYGAYARRYSRPVWDESYWVAQAPAAGYYGRNASTTNVRCDSNNSTIAAGAIGALVGGVLGSNVAARNAKTEGTVLGAVLGGALGASVGRANDKYKCDSRGPYFSYNETVPYRESSRFRYGSYDTAYYTKQRCRLAPAPVDAYARDYRYVRVCPDADGRYRIVG